MPPVEIPQRLFTAMVEHGLRERPWEACGIVAGRGPRGTKFYPTENAEKSPVLYSIPPEDILRILRQIEADGEELLAIFHTHPATEAYPSATDVRLAYYPEAVYLIMSLVDPQAPVLRGFHIVEGEISERTVEIVD